MKRPLYQACLPDQCSVLIRLLVPQWTHLVTGGGPGALAGQAGLCAREHALQVLREAAGGCLQRSDRGGLRDAEAGWLGAPPAARARRAQAVDRVGRAGAAAEVLQPHARRRIVLAHLEGPGQAGPRQQAPA